MAEELKRTVIYPGEYELQFLGLCSYCVVNENAHLPVRIGPDQQGMARDLLGQHIDLPNIRQTLEWKVGNVVPSGNMLSELVMALGGGIHIQDYNGNLPLYAVTYFHGDAVCYMHLSELRQYDRVNKRR